MSTLTMLDPPPLTGGWSPAQIHTDIAHPARVYDYYLAGKDNYQVDRDAAEAVLAFFPQARQIAQANRVFLNRAVRTLLESGIGQFLDIGTGLPGHDHPAETIHALNPAARLALVDNNPLVLTHAMARLRGPRPKRTAVIEADLREPETILSHPALRDVLDLDRPVAVLLGFVVHFLADIDHPDKQIQTLMGALAPDSASVLSHATAECQSELAHAAAQHYQAANMPITLRTPVQIATFFDGLQVQEPGLVAQPWWHPDGEIADDPESNWGYGALAYKR